MHRAFSSILHLTFFHYFYFYYFFFIFFSGCTEPSPPTNKHFSLFKVSCHSVTESKMESRLVVHVKMGCSSGYMCLTLTR